VYVVSNTVSKINGGVKYEIFVSNSSHQYFSINSSTDCSNGSITNNEGWAAWHSDIIIAKRAALLFADA
jgi:hypothetical protein